jgi:hypothetical protein
MKNKKQDSRILEYVFLLITILLVAYLAVQFKNQDINFARSVFSGLVHGKSSTQKYIDWEHFTAGGFNIAEAYAKLPDDKEKKNYRNQFIRNFAIGFAQTGGRLNYFTRWSVYSQDGLKVTVAAYNTAHKKTLLFTINKAGKKKLIGLDILK